MKQKVASYGCCSKLMETFAKAGKVNVVCCMCVKSDLF